MPPHTARGAHASQAAGAKGWTTSGSHSYHGAIVKVEGGTCLATGLPTCKAVVPWWPRPGRLAQR